MKRQPSFTFLAAAAALLAGPANATVSVYGNLDLAPAQFNKSQGHVSGTVFGLAGGAPAPDAVLAPKGSVKRLSTSLSSQSRLGLRAREDLGGGYAARIQLEMGLIPDTGTLTGDGRVFGRTAYVALTTPYGETWLGRLPSPMLVAFGLSTPERLGSTDLLGAGLVVNNLQSYQDNSIAYLAAGGSWRSMISASANAGVAERISAARSAGASATTGQILGGGTSSAESSDKRGRSLGAMLAYSTPNLTATGALNVNKLGVPMGLASAGGFVPVFSTERYVSYMVGVRYRFAETSTVLAGTAHLGRLEEQGNADPRTRALAVSVRQSVGAVDLIAQAGVSEYTNFTKGRDTGFMLGAEHALSKRTVLYSRLGTLKDSRGAIVQGGVTPVPLAGGPAFLQVRLGMQELPVFSGADVPMDGRTSLLAVGLRHEF